MFDARIRIRPLLSASDPAFPAMASLYEASFPAEERVPTDALAQSIGASAPGQFAVKHLLVAEDEPGLVAMVYFSYLSRAELGFITYLAVDPERNGQGIGLRMLRACLKQLALDAAGAGLRLRATVFEVEREEDATDRQNLAVRRRRLAFFAHAGAQVIADAYVQPSLSQGLPEVPLNLLIFPEEEPPAPRELVQSVYAEAYGLAADHPLVLRVVAATEPGTFAPGRATRSPRPSE